MVTGNLVGPGRRPLMSTAERIVPVKLTSVSVTYKSCFKRLPTRAATEAAGLAAAGWAAGGLVMPGMDCASAGPAVSSRAARRPGEKVLFWIAWNYFSERRNNWAFSATMTVLALISTAPMAGLSTKCG